MKKFERLLESVNIKNIESLLASLSSPCYESELLRAAFPGIDISGASPLRLYQSHFLLYHILYRLKDAFLEQNKYLHIHFMRTFLIDYPEPGRCRFYFPIPGRFCDDNCESGSGYCRHHHEKIGDNRIDELSDRYFYLDQRNYDALDENTAEAFLSGTWEILSHYDEFEKSYKVLGLPKTADVQMIRTAFRKLAKQYHPDLGETSHDKFNDINRAYRLLMKILPNLSGENPFSKERR